MAVPRSKQISPEQEQKCFDVMIAAGDYLRRLMESDSTVSDDPITLPEKTRTTGIAGGCVNVFQHPNTYATHKKNKQGELSATLVELFDPPTGLSKKLIFGGFIAKAMLDQLGVHVYIEGWNADQCKRWIKDVFQKTIYYVADYVGYIGDTEGQPKRFKSKEGTYLIEDYFFDEIEQRLKHPSKPKEFSATSNISYEENLWKPDPKWLLPSPMRTPQEAKKRAMPSLLFMPTAEVWKNLFNQQHSSLPLSSSPSLSLPLPASPSTPFSPSSLSSPSPSSPLSSLSSPRSAGGAAAGGGGGGSEFTLTPMSPKLPISMGGGVPIPVFDPRLKKAGQTDDLFRIFAKCSSKRSKLTEKAAREDYITKKQKKVAKCYEEAKAQDPAGKQNMREVMDSLRMTIGLSRSSS